MNREDYAISEVFKLMKPEVPSLSHPITRYIASLFSELAYYHIPQFEIDGRKRAKILPCSAHAQIVASGTASSFRSFLQTQFDIGLAFIVEDESCIVIGTQIRRTLFIAFRGTVDLYDWNINRRVRLIRSDPHSIVKYHSGFLRETIRVAEKVNEQLRNPRFPYSEVVVTGHSLGGAIASISPNYLRTNHMPLVCVFGSPRYTNRSIVPIQAMDAVHTRRKGDMVPMVPPTWLGYSNYAVELHTDGSIFAEGASPLRWLGNSLLAWPRFFLNRFGHHSIEVYRQELGAVVGAKNYQKPLAPYEKI